MPDKHYISNFQIYISLTYETEIIIIKNMNKQTKKIVIDEKRRAPRLKEDNEVTIIVVSGREPLPKEKVIYDSSKDISVSGARIHAHILLPVGTLLKIELTLKTVHQMITVMGKVKWIKIICDDESYEEGVEFVNTADEAIKKLKDYISWKQKKTSLKPI